MYKVFVKENPIILTDSKNNLDNYSLLLFESSKITALISLLENDLLNGIYLYHPNLALMWAEFKSNFKIIEAAGGLVKNPQNEVLMICRFDKWDLPKGKMKKNETKEMAALREVTEECGVNNLKIIKPLPTTYHIYTEKENERILKISYWFEMKTTSNDALIPQTEEGITHAKFVKSSEINEVLENTYTNIKILLQEVQLTT